MIHWLSSMIYFFVPGLFVVLQAMPARADVQDPKSLQGHYDRAFDTRIVPRLDPTRHEDRLVQLKAIDPNSVTPDDLYLIRRNMLLHYENAGRIQEHQRLCQEMRLRSDDFSRRADCLYRRTDISQAQKKNELERILEQSLVEDKGTNVPISVALDLLYTLSDENDVAGARILYKRTMDATPKDAQQSIFNLKWTIASIYTNPFNSLSTIHEGLKIWDELQAVIQKEPSLRAALPIIALNKGDAHLRSLRDYERALQEFDLIPSDSSYALDAKIYGAMALVGLGRISEAARRIKDVDLETYQDPARKPFLACYLQMVRRRVDSTVDLHACAVLPLETPPEVLFHITREISGASVPAEIEMGTYRQFWRAFQDKLLPQLQESTDRHVDAMELERTRRESQIKDLELKNFTLLKVLFAAMAVALALALASFWRLHLKNLKIQKLQTYIQKSVLSRFLPPLMVEEIVQGRSRMESEPKDELITVLFCDMVGFTALSGRLGAEASATILNQFMQTMSEVIYENQGTIDKFMGDAVMVLFGAPSHLPELEQVHRATACARSMIRTMAKVNQEIHQRFAITVDVRIGIHQGPAIVGTFGSEKRSDYTAIGPTVNLASRIEGRARPNEIMLSQSVARLVPADEVLDRGLFRLKGIDGGVRLFALKQTQADAQSGNAALASDSAVV